MRALPVSAAASAEHTAPIPEAVPAPPQILAWLLDTTNRMVSCRNVVTLLDLAYDALRDGLGYDRVGLQLIDPDRQVIACHLGTDDAGRKHYLSEREVPLQPPNFHTRLLADPRMQPGGPGYVYLDEAEVAGTYAERKYLDGQPKQNLLVALRTMDGPLGYVSVDNLVSGRPIGEIDALPLVAFANALAASFENVTLLESRARRIHDLDANLRQRVEHLAWLQEASSLLGTLQDLDGVLDAIYSSVRWGLLYDRVGLFLVAPRHGRLVAYEVRGTDEYGERTGGCPGFMALDDPALAAHSPQLHHLLQGHPFFFCREQLAIALRHDGELVGYISVDNLLSGRAITAEDASPLVAFSSQAALAISRAQLWADHEAQSRYLAQRVTELEWLRDMSRRINVASTLNAVLDVVYTGIREGLGYDRVGVWLFNQDGSLLEECRSVNTGVHPVASIVRTLSPSEDSALRIPGLAQLLRGEVACYLSDPAGYPPGTPTLLPGDPTQCLLVALRSPEAMSGVIVVDNVSHGHSITLDQSGPLLALAGQVDTVIRNLRLQEQERAERARLALLLESAHALNSTLDSDQILRELAARLIAALDASRAIFGRIDPAAGTYTVVAQQVVAGCAPLAFEVIHDVFTHYPVLEHVLASGSPFHGYIGDAGFPEQECAYLRCHDLQEELIVPVAVRGEVIGVLEVHWDRRVKIGEETITLCTSIAEQAAVALGNAGLYASAAARAEQDALTGLLNHSALLECIDRAILSAEPFALVLIDIDNFKLFNDTYGHPTGDAVLTSVAGILRSACREGDVAGRYGGDEMAVVLRGATPAEAAAVMQRLSEALQTRPHVTLDGAVIPISISAGVACFPHHGLTRQELVAVADDAMYATKRRSGHRLLAPGRHGEISYWQDLQLRDVADLLGDSPFGVLEGLVSAVDAKDRYTREHSEHVTQLALLLVDALGLPAEQRRVIAVAGLLHDVGKIGVPDRVLRKPGALANEEYAAIKRHVSYGVAIIRGVLNDAAVVDAVAYHHERWDGRGYPHAIPGPATPLLGRIMQVADAASAMLLDRPYRQGLPWEQVAARLRAGMGTQFDPSLVEPFLDAVLRVQSRHAS